jgi:hypothetical protein
MYHINFIASAYDKPNINTYQSFLIPFTFFALQTDPNSHVEIIVEDVLAFKDKYNKELVLMQQINKNFLIREPTYPRNKHTPNTYRFFEKPHVDSLYTYIADVDIMFLKNDIVSKYLESWPKNLPYNNKIRLNAPSRLTGIHMVKTKDYYTDQLYECQKQYYHGRIENDELILQKMCKEIFGLPELRHQFRPIYGIHFSPNRGPNKCMKLQTSKLYYNKFIELKEKYKDLFEFEIFQKLVRQLHEDFVW